MSEYYYEDDAQAVDIINTVMKGKAPRPPRSRTAYHLISARISTEAHESLQAIALRMGYSRAGKGNVSMLLEAIGLGAVEVTPSVVRPRTL